MAEQPRSADRGYNEGNAPIGEAIHPPRDVMGEEFSCISTESGASPARLAPRSNTGLLLFARNDGVGRFLNFCLAAPRAAITAYYLAAERSLEPAPRTVW